MTDLATLAIKIDATQADDASRKLDGLTQTGARTEQALSRVTVTAGAQRAGMQQLSYQIGDVAQGLAMAAQSSDPLKMAFMTLGQQTGQVVQALRMMKGEATGLIGFLSTGWGAGIIAATSVLGPLIARLFDVGDAAKDAETALDKMIGKYRSAQAEKNKFRDAGKDLQAMKDEAAGLEAYIKAHGVRNSAGQLMFVYQQQQRLAELNAQIREGTDALDAERVSAWSLDKVMRGLGDAHKSTGAATHAHTGATRAHTAAVKEAIDPIEAMTNSIWKQADAMKAVGAAAVNDNTAGAWNVMMAQIGRANDPVSLARKAAQDAADATAAWNDQLDATLDRLTRIGGLGGNLAGWANALMRGNFSGLPGATGVAMQSLLGTQVGTTSVEGKAVPVTLGDELTRVFNKDGAFGKTMAGLLQGSGTGLAFSSAIFGQQGNNFGAAIGGGIGGALAGDVSKAIGGTLGKIAGGVLPVVGGILGGLIGSIFGKKPRGSGTVSNTGVSVSANDGGVKAGLDSFGLGLQQSVSKIADSLGGTVGTYSVGIGAYKGGYYQVSSSANDPFLGKAQYSAKSGQAVYDGLDGAAALRAAISVAIKQGAIQGVRAGVETLLKAGTDIEAQLAKALKFQGVFDDLKQATDPIGYAIDQITKKFDNLRTIFDEAGATAEDYAQLEQLLAVQRADALEQARKDVVSKVSDPLNLQIRILELLGESEKSVTAQRALELAGLKDSLQPLQAMVYTLEDARAVIDKFTPLRDDLRKFRDELLGGSAGTSFGFLTGQFRSTAIAAANGDATAMGALRGAANDYLDAAKENARSLQEYNAARAEVLAATDKAIFAADSQIDYQQAVIDSAKAQTSILADMQANLASLSSQLLTTQSTVASILKRWDGGENGSPFQVEVVA